LVVLSVMPIAWVFLYRLLRREVAAVTRAQSLAHQAATLGRSAGEIQHHMAEAVRRCASDSSNYALERDLGRVMTELAQYLKTRLGERNYAITIKRTVEGTGKLHKVYRDTGQDLGSRCKWDLIALDDSPVYSRFKKAALAKKIVFIGDTSKMPANEDAFRERARSCNYQTVIAFPVRLPAPMTTAGGPALPGTGEFNVAKLLGFFSIDSADVGAFEGLLKPSASGNATRDDDREPQDDLDVFYGIADSLATILVLTSGALKTETDGAVRSAVRGG
jgi:hypothetical protein